jgi:pimeloyl-ACP methyl ester carboxylesterase
MAQRTRSKPGAAADVSVKLTTIHGYQRAYRMAGSGPALLLLHGIGDSSESWVPLISALARRFTVVAPDLLGHGRSAKPRADYSIAAYANGMRDLTEVLGIDRFTVVGHSLGGGVAAQLAYQYPERVERMVLVASGGVARDVSPVLRVASAPFAELTLPLLQAAPSRLVTRVIVELLRVGGHDLGRDAGEVTRIIDGMPDGPARSAFTRTLRSVVDWRGQLVTMLDRCYLAERMPTMLVWGDHDGIIPVAHAHLAHQAMPNSRLEIIEGAGHFPHHTDPIRFVCDLEDFVDSTQPFVHDPKRTRQMLRKGAPGRRTVVPDADEPVFEVEA